MFSHFFRWFFIFSLFALQLSLISALGKNFSALNLFLVAIIFILLVADLPKALLWAMAGGFLLDIFSFTPFGLNLLALPLTIISAYFLLINLFTNRSLYATLSLITMSTIIYNFLLLIANYFFDFLGQNSGLTLNSRFWLTIGEGIVFNLIAGLIIFQILAKMNRKFKPVLDKTAPL